LGRFRQPLLCQHSLPAGRGLPPRCRGPPLRAESLGQRGASCHNLHAGAGAGTFSRTLARLGDGRFKTLNCSPTAGNRESFFSLQASADAYFHHGPFFELDDARYAADGNLAPFRDGYDVLFEDTTFQMYGRDRVNQVAFIAPRVRDQGLLIQVHKIRHPDDAVYRSRERTKDRIFKSRYFSEGQIAGKRSAVLDKMDDMQVDLATSVTALAAHFAYTLVTWNSGNFYTLVSSNSPSALRDFVTSMVPPAIPEEFCHEGLPLGFDHGEPFKVAPAWAWRDHDRVTPAKEVPSRFAAMEVAGSTL
jgi:tRNA (cmo5U34)-methyltransferase